VPLGGQQENRIVAGDLRQKAGTEGHIHDKRAIAMRIQELIEELPEDTKTQVEKAKKNYNSIIREAIRFETRLRLTPGNNSDIFYGEAGESLHLRVPIKLEAGLPKALENMNIPTEYEFAGLLSQIRPALLALKKSSKEVSDFIVGYQDRHELRDYVGGAICYADQEASSLLNELESFDLVREILKVDNNVLGCYFFKRSLFSEDAAYPTQTAGEIFLYWSVIGLVAQGLGLEIQTLAAVVIAHELAHAYSHLGYDIDGTRWNDESFVNSDPAVTEGIAQYYTGQVMRRLQHKIPGGYEAYQILLQRQPPDYQTHLEWIEKMGISSEALRSALIVQRKGKPIELRAFNLQLHENVGKLLGSRY